MNDIADGRVPGAVKETPPKPENGTPAGASRPVRILRSAAAWLFDRFFYWEEVEAAPPKPKGPGWAQRIRTATASLSARFRKGLAKPPALVPTAEDAGLRERVTGFARLCGFDRPETGAALLSAARCLAAWVGDLPASAENHHSEDGGLLAHSLDALERAAPKIARLRITNASPERAAILADPYRLASAIASLYHDLGKVMSVRVRFEDGSETEWDPLSEPLAAFRGRHGAKIGRWWVPRRGQAASEHRHERHNPRLLARALPADAWEGVRPFHEDLLNAVGIEAPASPIATEIRRILGRADHESAAGERPGHAEHADAAEPADDGAGEGFYPTLLLSRGLVAPPFRGILHRKDLAEAVSRHGANKVDSPILLGGYTCAIECGSPAHSFLVKPNLDELQEAGLLATCTQHADCPEVEFDALVESTPPNRAGESRRGRFTFVSLLALGGPILPNALGLPNKVHAAFGGRITFPGDHRAKPNDFRLCVRTDSYAPILNLVGAFESECLRENVHWIRIPDEEGRPLVAIFYPKGLSPLVPNEMPEVDSERARRRLAEQWDRILRLRSHILPQPPNQGHEVFAGGGTRWVIPLIPELSASILGRLRGKKPRGR